VILHLGVIDVPYAADAYAKPRSPKVTLGTAKRGKVSAPKPSSSGGTKTTAEVAEILEDKYHVQELFFEERGADIAGALEQSMADALENLLLGAPPNVDATLGATSAIDAMFKQFLSGEGLNGIEPGVPTRAALMGVSHRFKHPYAHRGPRPSFIDTSLYVSNFKSWID
jgi:hypothetical protein